MIAIPLVFAEAISRGCLPVLSLTSCCVLLLFVVFSMERKSKTSVLANIVPQIVVLYIEYHLQIKIKKNDAHGSSEGLNQRSKHLEGTFVLLLYC